MSQELHEIQIQILKKLLFKPKLKYTDLRPSEEIENNKLNFHLNQLKDLNLIIKEDEFYKLTHKGKEFAGRIDTDNLKVKKQAKISAWICPIKNDGIETEYLIYTRLKSPFMDARDLCLEKLITENRLPKQQKENYMKKLTYTENLK